MKMKDEDEMEEGSEDDEEENEEAEEPEEPKEPKPKKKKADSAPKIAATKLFSLPIDEFKEAVRLFHPFDETEGYGYGQREGTTLRLEAGKLTVREMDNEQVALVDFERAVEYAGEPLALCVNAADLKDALGCFRSGYSRDGGIEVALSANKNELVLRNSDTELALGLRSPAKLSELPKIKTEGFANIDLDTLRTAFNKARKFSDNVIVEVNNAEGKGTIYGNGRITVKAVMDLGTGRHGNKPIAGLNDARGLYQTEKLDALIRAAKHASNGKMNFGVETPAIISTDIVDDGKTIGHANYYLAPRVEPAN